MLRLFLALWLAVTPAFAWAGSMTLLGAGATGATTFNPADSGTEGALSGGNLIWTSTTGGSGAITRSFANHSSGKFYLEATLTTNVAGNYQLAVGAANGTQGLNSVLSQTANGFCLFNGDANIYYNNVSIGTVSAAPVAGDVIGMAIDITAQKVWFRVNGGNWNNSGLNDPTTGVGGASYASMSGAVFAAGYVSSVNTGNKTTTNFGATSYGTSAPSGFSNW